MLQQERKHVKSSIGLPHTILINNKCWHEAIYITPNSSNVQKFLIEKAQLENAAIVDYKLCNESQTLLLNSQCSIYALSENYKLHQSNISPFFSPGAVGLSYTKTFLVVSFFFLSFFFYMK